MKTAEIEKNILDHIIITDIITQESNKLVSEEFAERLKQPKSATKNDIVDFVKEVDFDEKLKKKKNEKVTSNKTKLVEG